MTLMRTPQQIWFKALTGDGLKSAVDQFGLDSVSQALAVFAAYVKTKADSADNDTDARDWNRVAALAEHINEKLQKMRLH